MRRRATISTTRAAEKSSALSFLNQMIFLRQHQTSRHVFCNTSDSEPWGVIIVRPRPSGGASIYVNFGCPNDVFLPKVFQNRAHGGPRRFVSLSLSRMDIIKRRRQRVRQVSRLKIVIGSSSYHHSCRELRVLIIFKAEAGMLCIALYASG